MISQRYASFCGELKKKRGEKKRKKREKKSNERGKVRNGVEKRCVCRSMSQRGIYLFRGKYFVFSNEKR